LTATEFLRLILAMKLSGSFRIGFKRNKYKPAGDISTIHQIRLNGLRKLGEGCANKSPLQLT
jgi:hypothetical protein